MKTADFVEKLPDFIQELKRHGYTIGTDEAVNAHKIIISGSFHSIDSTDQTLDYLQHSLSPLFSSNAEQQQRFRQHLENWSVRNLDSFNDDKNSIIPDDEPGPKFSWFATTLLVLAITLAWGYFSIEPEPKPSAAPTETAPTKDSSNGTKIPVTTTGGASIDSDPASLKDNTGIGEKENPKRFTDTQWISPLTFAALAGVATLAFVLWRRRRPQITRGTTDGAETTPLNLASDIKKLDAPATMRKGIQRLRQHEQVNADAIDINASIQATITNGGLFRPISGTRPQLPEFVLLIESNSVNDHQRVYSTQWYHYLLDQGLVITPYWYTGAPWQELVDEQNHRISWQQLVSQNTQKRLLIMGDAEQWFHPLTGKLPIQSHDISEFKRAALLTPKAVIDWDNREWQFQQLGLTPFHFDVGGMQQLSDYWQKNDENLEYSVASNQNHFPEILENYRVDDYRDYPFVENVVLALQRYLTEDCFKLLCATALYPECHFGITRHLADDYLGNIDSFTQLERLSPLCRLPWMRKGMMPDALRLQLLRKLNRGELQRLREKLSNSLTLDQDSLAGIRLRRHLAPSSQTHRLFRKLLGESEHSELSHDVIFIQIMAGSSPLRLTLASATVAHWKKLRQHTWLLALIAAAIALPLLQQSLFTPTHFIENYSSSMMAFSVYGFSIAIAIAAFFTTEFYLDRPLALRSMVKLIASFLLGSGLLHLLITETSDTIELTHGLPYYQCLITAISLHLQSRLSSSDSPSSHSVSPINVIQALVDLSARSLLQWILVCNLAFVAFSYATKDALVEFLIRTGYDWNDSGNTLLVLPQFLIDLFGLVFLAAMVCVATLCLKGPLRLSSRQILLGVSLSIEIALALGAVACGVLLLLQTWIGLVDDYRILHQLTLTAMSYPAAIIALGIIGCLHGLFDRRKTIVRGILCIAVFSVASAIYFILSDSIDGLLDNTSPYGNQGFVFGLFIAYCCLISLVKRGSDRNWANTLSLFFSIILLIALSTILSTIVMQLIPQVFGVRTANFLVNFLFNPAAAVIALIFLKKRIGNATTTESEPLKTSKIDEGAYHQPANPIPIMGWCLLIANGINLSGATVYLGDSHYNLYSEVLIFLTTLWLCVKHPASITSAFVVMIISALASIFGLLLFAPLISIQEQALETAVWFNIATLFCCRWLIQYFSGHWHNGYLRLPNYTGMFSPLGLILVSGLSLSWYLGESLQIGWSLTWLTLWALMVSGRSFSLPRLSLFGIVVSALLLVSMGVDTWLENQLEMDSIFLGFYSLSLTTALMALYLGYTLSRAGALTSDKTSLLTVLLIFLGINLVTVAYRPDWPMENSYYAINGSIELAYVLLFAMGFVSRRFLRYGLSLVAVFALFSGAQFFANTYAAAAKQETIIDPLETEQAQSNQPPLTPTDLRVKKKLKSTRAIENSYPERIDNSPLPELKSLPEKIRTRIEEDKSEKNDDKSPPESQELNLPQQPMELTNENKIEQRDSQWQRFIQALSIHVNLPFVTLFSLLLSGLCGQWLREQQAKTHPSGAEAKYSSRTRD